MPGPSHTARYVFSALRDDGARYYVEAEASTISGARYRLETQGHTGLELVQDEFDDTLSRVNASDAFKDWDLRRRVEFQRRSASPESGRLVFWHVVKSEWLGVLTIGSWVAVRACGSRPLGGWSFLAYGFAAAYLLLFVQARLPSMLYQRLLEARSWNRWDEAERWVRRIRSLRWLTGVTIPEYDLLFTEAGALGWRGEWAAAEERVRPLENDPAFDPALYWSLLSGVYSAGGRYAEQAACAERALALNPDSPSNRIDLAYALALFLRDPARARTVLDELDEADVKPFAQAHYLLCRGAIALEEGRPEEAELLLAESVEHARSHAGNPVAKSLVEMIRGYHSLALRRCGRQEAAEREWAEVAPYLEATPPRPLLELWKAAAPPLPGRPVNAAAA